MLKLGVTLYSFNADWYTYRYTLQDCLAAVATLGEGQGVEVVAPQMDRGYPHTSPEFEYTFKRLMDEYGLRPSAYGAYGDGGRFVGRWASRQEQLDYLVPQIRAAARLGFPVIRMQFSNSVLYDLLPYAERYDVKMALEVHSPMTIESLAPAIDRILTVNSPYLGLAPDTGAFCRAPAQVFIRRFREQGVPEQIVEHVVQRWHDRPSMETLQAEVAKMGGAELGSLMAVESQVYFGHGDPIDLMPLMPHISHVHGKFFGVDESGSDSAVRFDEVTDVLIQGRFDGFVSCEYEGHHWNRDLSALDQIRSVQAYIARRVAQTAR